MMQIDRFHATAVARIELRRRVRQTRDNIWQLVAIGIFGLFAIPFLLAAVFGLFTFGAAISGGSVETPLAYARLGLVYGWIGVALFGGYRAYAMALEPDRLAGMLTTISHRDLVAGQFLAELFLWGGILSIFLIPSTIAFAVGAISPLAIPLLLLVGVLVLTTALLSGFLIALVIRNMGARSLLLTRIRTILFAVLGIVYVGVFFTQAFTTVLDPIYAVVAPTPVGWIADLALLGTVGDVSTWRAVGGLAGSVAFIVLAGITMTRLAGALWYADGVHVSHSHDATSARFERLETILPRDVVGVLTADLIRARRAPITLSFVLYPLFFLIWPLMTAIETREIGSGFPLWVLLCGAWITGALFTLNVLGHEGAVLPVTLLGDRPERAIVGGHLLASWSIGVPFTVIGTTVFGIAAGYSSSSMFTLSASALVLSIAAGLLAIGIGAVLPRYDEVTVTRSTTAVIPSMLAFGIYSFSISIIAIPTLVAHSGAGPWLADPIGTSALGVRAIGFGLTTFLALACGLVAARYAHRRVVNYEFDR